MGWRRSFTVIDWAIRAPAPHGENAEGEIEIRQRFEVEDFGESKSIAKALEIEKNLKKAL